MKELLNLKMELKTTEPIVDEYKREFYGLSLGSRYLYKICDNSGSVSNSTLTGTNEDLERVRKSEDYNYPCFHALMTRIKSDTAKVTVRYHINKNSSFEAIRDFCNYCWMNKKQLTKHINQVKRIIPNGWSYKFLETGILENDCFFIEFTFNLQELHNKMKILFVLTWVRHCCEFSGNYALYDAYLLKDAAKKGLAPRELMQYPEMELFHITNKAFIAHYYSDQSIGGYNVLPIKDGMFDLKVQMDNIKKFSMQSIVSLFKNRFILNEDTDEWRDCYGIMKNKVTWFSARFAGTTSLNWLNNPGKFMSERLPVHIKNWEIIKQLKTKEDNERN